MSLASVFRHIVIVFFLTITLFAFLLTLLRVPPPFLDRIVLFSYAMMAPYQGYERLNAGLMAEGQLTEGKWQPISLDPYFPVIRGETHMRQFFMIYEGSGAAMEQQMATRTAEKLLQLEHDRGHPYTAIRLWWNQWEPSPAGYEHQPDTQLYRRPLVTIHE